MISLEKIRLDKTEEAALKDALSDVNDEVYVVGSRLRPESKGGDIDLVIFSGQNSLELSRKITRRFFLKCEESIDVMVFDKKNLTDEQKAFLSSLSLVRIK
jgi:predicted nucleotidyltransferase